MKPSEVLVTGGTGTLGRREVERLRSEGREVRMMSRGGQSGTVKGDLLTGEGIEEAVRGVDIVVHCASGHRKTRQTDGGGTEFLLRKAAQAGVSHVVFISIVGVDRNPFFSLHRVRLPASPGDLVDEPIEVLLSTGPGHHRGALCGERSRRGLPDAARGPGHHRHPARRLHHLSMG